MRSSAYPETPELRETLRTSAIVPAVVATLVVLAAVSAVTVFPAVSGLVERFSIAVVGALGLWWSARLLLDAYPSTPARPAVRRPQIGRLPERLEHLERMLLFSQWSALDEYARLRPLLRPIVRDRLLDGRRVDLDREPRRAQKAIGEPLFALVAPDRRRPEREEPGLSLRAIEDMIEVVEALGTDADR